MAEPIVGNFSQKEKPFPIEHWMIRCSWEELYQEPTIATADNPDAKGRKFTRRVRSNQVIEVHPVVHAIRMLQVKQEYTIDFAMPISKKYFDLITSPSDQQVSNIVDKIIDEGRLVT